jgi:hypothetical protein
MEYKLEDVLISAGGGKRSVKRSKSYATAPLAAASHEEGEGPREPPPAKVAVHT